MVSVSVNAEGTANSANTVDNEALNLLRNSTFRDSSTGQFMQNPAIGTLERYSPVASGTKDMTQDALFLQLQEEHLNDFFTSDNAGGVIDALATGLKIAIKASK